MHKITTREYFSNLCFVDPYSLYHISFKSKPAIEYPVFTKAELNREPLKWLKYLLLVRLGLRSIKELTQTIKRYPINHWHVAQSHCVDLLASSLQNHEQLLVVVKLVPVEKAGQLPNFQIRRLDEVEVAFTAAWKAHRPTDQEIWLCKSRVGPGTMSFAGRLCLPGRNSFGPSRLEVVWYTSPRLLENIHLSSLKYPFLSAELGIGKLSFQIKKLFIPLDHSSKGLTKTQLLNEFQFLGNQIALHREKIETLQTIVEVAGANELSIEFQSNNGRFQFIDWDTEVELAGRVKTP